MLIYLFHRSVQYIFTLLGLFSTFLQVISFLQVKLASQKDNCKSYIPAFVAKIRWYLSRNSNKIKNSHVQNFFVFGQNSENQ